MFFRACAGILEIEPTCGESEIRKAYFKKSKEYHPDKHAVSAILIDSLINISFFEKPVSNLKRITGRTFTISKCFYRSKPELTVIFYFLQYKAAKNLKTIGAHTESTILIWFLRPSKKLFISWHCPFKDIVVDPEWFTPASEWINADSALVKTK